MTDPVFLYALLCASAFLAGVMNSVAGGGTLLTFPALEWALAPVVGPSAASAFANGTSTVALLPGSFAGAFAYRAELAPSRRFVQRMVGPSAVGGLLGAWLVGRDTESFKNLVPWLILTAAVLFLVQAPISRRMRATRPDHEPGPLAQGGLIAFQFLIAVYGGYFGAGIGILMISTLTLMGVGDIHRVNAVKTFLAAVINAASVVVFVRDGLVNWPFAAVMAGSAVAGGYLGARVARRLPAGYVRGAVVVIGFGLAALYFIRRYA